MNGFIGWLRQLPIGTMFRVAMERIGISGSAPITSSLSMRVFRRDGSIEDKGVVSTKVVTDDFVALVVDALQGLAVDEETFKYHDSGTDNTPEAAGDSALAAPCGDARTVGTQIEGATANIYKSVATHTYGGAYTIVEHGLFNASAAGVLMDRSVFSGVVVASGDKIEFTYQITFTAGG